MQWATLIISVVAILAPIAYAVVVDRRAQAAAGKASARAQHAQDTADDMSRSLGEIATSLASIAGQGNHGVARSVALPPQPRWNLERLGNGAFVLRNVGAAVATGVVIEGLPAGVVVLDAPHGVSLTPVEGATLRLGPTSVASIPPQITVYCVELGATLVSVPS